MSSSDITHRRLRSLRLSGNPLATPEVVVGRLGAVQSQDFGPGKWSVAQRTSGATNADMDRAFVDGAILRTHVLRPTWHFVSPADIRWMLDLTAPRVLMANAQYHRQYGVDDGLLARCHAPLADALEGGKHCTRPELAVALKRAGLTIGRAQLGLILMHAELNGLLCSGAPRGKQQTYALLEERAPQAKRLARDEALAELTLRYFTGHGPATAKDFRWWSSLTLTDIKRGIEKVSSQLEQEVVDGVIYWSARAESGPPMPPSPTVHLLQGYDEYIVGYSESKYLLDRSGLARAAPRPRGIYNHAIVLDGQITGHWKPRLKRDGVTVEVDLFASFDDAQTRALGAAIDCYATFLGLPATVSL